MSLAASDASLDAAVPVCHFPKENSQDANFRTITSQVLPAVAGLTSGQAAVYFLPRSLSCAILVVRVVHPQGHELPLGVCLGQGDQSVSYGSHDVVSTLRR